MNHTSYLGNSSMSGKRTSKSDLGYAADSQHPHDQKFLPHHSADLKLMLENHTDTQRQRLTQLLESHLKQQNTVFNKY